MKRLKIFIVIISIFITLSSCRQKNTPAEEQMPVVSVQAEPVICGNIRSEITFNGSTVCLKKDQLLSPVSGYISDINIRFGQEVHKDQIIFTLMTREAKALGAFTDSTRIPGTVLVKATSGGFISELNINEPGIYVVEGSVLCSITDNSSLVVRLNIPYEDVSLLSSERSCRINLPDNTVITGTVSRIIPTVDETTQTQTVLIRPESSKQLPENLNVVIGFNRSDHINALLVSKSSLMANETQSEFWVMKLSDCDIAVRIPVEKGIENDSLVEVISHDLKANDLIISSGAYGLPDSTLVSIIK